MTAPVVRATASEEAVARASPVVRAGKILFTFESAFVVNFHSNMAIGTGGTGVRPPLTDVNCCGVCGLKLSDRWFVLAPDAEYGKSPLPKALLRLRTGTTASKPERSERTMPCTVNKQVASAETDKPYLIKISLAELKDAYCRVDVTVDGLQCRRCRSEGALRRTEAATHTAADPSAAPPAAPVQTATPAGGVQPTGNNNARAVGTPSSLKRQWRC